MPRRRGTYTFTSESVTEGHPDKVCDQISDAVLDAVISKETELEAQGYRSATGVAACVSDVRCAVETLVSGGTVIVSGELRTQAYVDIQELVRATLREIGYTRSEYGFDSESCGIINMLHEQSVDIARGVDRSFDVQRGVSCDPLDRIGAGDQGMMFGYACDETETFMPMPAYVAQRLAHRLAQVRKTRVLPYLRPDGKVQVSVAYKDGRPTLVQTVVISAQHDEDAGSQVDMRRDIIQHVVEPVLEATGIAWKGAEILINPTGRFVIGGPVGDTGLTGRKIIVDSYGGMGRHGGGCFSGKDCTKVDRSAAYAARWVAKNVVAAQLAQICEIQLAYAIGVARPVSICVDTHNTAQVSEALIEAAIAEVFDLRPAAIIRDLDLWRPIYQKTAAYGHFGRDDAAFTWEQTNRAGELRAAVDALQR